MATAPGFAAENDGLLHVRGVDDGVLYVMDGIPVMDRIDALSGAAPDLGAFRSLDVVTGGIPAEFGGRSGAVVVLERKSGLESKWMGTLTTGAGNFSSSEISSTVGGSLGKKLGIFVSDSLSRSSRFLDPPDPGNFNNQGGAARLGMRLDFKPNDKDQFILSASGAGSEFRVPNTLLQELAGQRQRQHLRDDEESLGWNHIWSTALHSSLSYYRQAYSARLTGSAFDVPLFAAQDRSHIRQGMTGTLTYVHEHHVIKGGASFSHIASREFFTFAVTDPQAAADQGFGDSVLLFSPANPFLFNGSAVFRQLSSFLQDDFSPVKNLTISAGVRFDHAGMLETDQQVSPRVGLAYYLPRTGTTLRASFNRLFMPPQVENLLLSGSPQAQQLSPFAMAAVSGGAPVRAERVSAWDIGITQSVRKLFRVDVDFWDRRFRNFDDPNVLFSTQIIFPNSVAAGFARGIDARLEVPIHNGWSSYASYSNSRILQTGPVNGGLFLTDNVLAIGTGTRFVPDHDQRNVGDAGITWSHRRNGLWATLSARYESGVPIDVDPGRLDSLRSLPGANLVNLRRGRVSPHTVAGFSAGMDLIESRHLQMKAHMDIQNLTNTTYLYNFGNPFSGTHFGSPRLIAGRLRFVFR